MNNLKNMKKFEGHKMKGAKIFLDFTKPKFKMSENHTEEFKNFIYMRATELFILGKNIWKENKRARTKKLIKIGYRTYKDYNQYQKEKTKELLKIKIDEFLKSFDSEKGLFILELMYLFINDCESLPTYFKNIFGKLTIEKFGKYYKENLFCQLYGH